MEIRPQVDALTRKYRTSAPFDLAASLGIIILREPLGDICSYYNKCFRQQFIHINQDLNEPTARFTCVHELGHAVLHPTLNTPFLRKNTLSSVDKLETEANRFAVDLACSDYDLQPFLDRNITEAAVYMDIPVALAQYRMHSAQLVLCGAFE